MLSSGLDPIDCPPVANSAFRRLRAASSTPWRASSVTRPSTRFETAPRTRTSARSARVPGRSTCRARSPRCVTGWWCTALPPGRARTREPGRATSRAAGRSARSRAGVSRTQSFVVHAAPGVSTSVRFQYAPGHPSDGTAALPASWIKLPSGSTSVRSGRKTTVNFKISVPSSAPAGMYSGTVVVGVSNGQTLQVPVFASVALRDLNRALGNPSGPQARIASGGEVYARFDTVWPFVPGSGLTGAGSDWFMYPVELGDRLTEARFSVYDAAAGDETYDLYLYDEDFDLLATSHPFSSPGMTDVVANNARAPTTAAAPQVLTLTAPADGPLLRRRQPGEGLAASGNRRLRRLRADARRGRPLATALRSDAMATLLIANPWASGVDEERLVQGAGRAAGGHRASADERPRRGDGRGTRGVGSSEGALRVRRRRHLQRGAERHRRDDARRLRAGWRRQRPASRAPAPARPRCGRASARRRGRGRGGSRSVG